MNNNITVFLEVFNEAHRLEACLINFQWADELVVFVKKSTDETLSIAKRYATHVYEVDYCETSENFATNMKKHSGKDWCLFATASSLIDPELVDEMVKLTSDSSFKYDVIGLPYTMMVFGLSGKCSPWGEPYKYALIKKSVLVLSDVLHNEISWVGKKSFVIDASNTIGRFYHCTHSNPEDFFMRHMRYVKHESQVYCQIHGDKAFKVSFVDLIKSIGKVIVKKRSIYSGRNGIVLSLAYVSYFLMRLVFIWFELRGVNSPYSEIRKLSVSKWNKIRENK